MVRRCLLAVSALLMHFAGAARADAYELSLDVHPLGGVVAVGDSAVPGHRRSSHLVGAAVRMTYATHDLFAYEAEVAMARSGAVEFGAVAWDEERGALRRVTELGRAQVGIRLRLGARYVPTLHVAVGAQTRPATPSLMLLADGSAIDGPRTSRSWDVIVAGGVGFEYRIGARWMTGLSLGAVQAFPLAGERFQSVEGSAYVAYYWYPN